jgi:ribokinase
MKALTVGGAMIDTIAIIESDRIERMTMLNAESSFLLLEEGRKTEAVEVSTHCGGGSVNAAVAMARLGLDVAALIKLGRDDRAETVLARLLQEGVSTRWATRDGRAPTGASVLISSHDRNAAVFTFRGANTLLEPTDLRDDAFAVDVVYVAGLSNKSADCFPLIVQRAKEHGALVATNPGVRQLSARGGAFQECLALIDILTINRAEADVLVPSLVARFGEGGPTPPLAPGEEPPPLAARGLVGGGYEMGLAAFLAALRQLGVKTVVLTDGLGGAFVGLRDAILFCPAMRTSVAGTAGAGDAFAATFIAFSAVGRSPEDSLRAATINAASVVSHVDTQTGLLRRQALEARLAETAGRLAVRRWLL